MKKEKIQLDQFEIMTFGDLMNYHEDPTKKKTIQDIYVRIGYLTMHIENLTDCINDSEKGIRKIDESYLNYCKTTIKMQQNQLNKLKQLIKDLRLINCNLKAIRQFSWEIALGYLNNENIPEDQYIKQTLKVINDCQNKVEELADLDIEQYPYWYDCYLRIEDQLKAIN